MTLKIAEMILGPPLAPTTARSPVASESMIGDMELSGFFPGRMKLAGLGDTP